MSLIVPQERTDAKCPEYGEMASAGRPEKLPGSVCGSWPWRKSLARRSSMRREKGSKKKEEEAREEGSEEEKVEGVSQERSIARGQSARRTGLFQEQSVNPH